MIVQEVLPSEMVQMRESNPQNTTTVSQQQG